MNVLKFLPSIVSTTSKCVIKPTYVRAFPKYLSASVALPPDIEFDELKQKLDEITLIDVRTSKELLTVGMIPNTKHINVFYVGPDILLPDDQFEEKLGFKKPKLDDPVVVTCLAGIRARTAQLAMMAAGYNNVRVYVGSFQDWLEKGGPVVYPETENKQ